MSFDGCVVSIRGYHLLIRPTISLWYFRWYQRVVTESFLVTTSEVLYRDSQILNRNIVTPENPTITVFVLSLVEFLLYLD